VREHSHTVGRILRFKKWAKKSGIEQKINEKIALQEYILDFSFVAFFLCDCANFSLKLA